MPIPAFAPAESSPLFELGDAVGELVDAGELIDVVAVDDGDAAEDDDCGPIDTEPTNSCGMVIYVFESQQFLVRPQHHLVEFAVASQGVSSLAPLGSRSSAQTFRHFPLLISLSVQYSAQYRLYVEP